MDGKSRHRSHRRPKDYKQRYPYSSSCHNGRINNANPSDLHNQQSRSMADSHFPAQISVEPLMANKILPFSNTIPQERQSWIHSMKKTKIHGSTEQKTQYLETMLRMQSFIRSVDNRKTNESIESGMEYVETIVRIPQEHKSSINTSTFDRMRFADQRMTTSINTMNNRNKNSLHLVNHINNHDEISTIEEMLSDHEQQSNVQSSSNQLTNGKSTRLTNSDSTPFSAFLIDNCDEPEPPPSPIEQVIQQNQGDVNHQRTLLVNRFDTFPTKRKRLPRGRKNLCTTFLRNQKSSITTEPAKQPAIRKDPVSIVNSRHQQESSSDWILEYDTTETDQILQLTSTIKNAATTMIDDDKIANINTIVKSIEKQQTELRKLRQHVISMLTERSKAKTEQQRSSVDQELLKFLNQPIISGCWLCSGNTYSEVATQCNNPNE